MSSYLVYVDGHCEDVSPRNGSDFELHEIYDLLGVTMIEAHCLRGGDWLIIDEEGKLNGSKFNEEATRIFHETYGGLDVIVGNALVCEKGTLK